MFLLAIADSTGVPMVGGVDAMIVLMAIVNRSQAYLSAMTAIIGSLVGSLILFLIARKGGEEYQRRHTSSARGNKLRAWFHEYGLLTVFVPAVVPVIPLPLKIFIISAGAMQESPVTFSLVLLAARVPRYLFLAWLGSRLGREPCLTCATIFGSWSLWLALSLSPFTSWCAWFTIVELLSRNLLSQSEIYLDGRDHFHGIAIEQGRLVNPLPHGFERGARQQRVSTHQLQVSNGSVFTDGANQPYDA